MKQISFDFLKKREDEITKKIENHEPIVIKGSSDWRDKEDWIRNYKKIKTVDPDDRDDRS